MHGIPNYLALRLREQRRFKFGSYITKGFDYIFAHLWYYVLFTLCFLVAQAMLDLLPDLLEYVVTWVVLYPAVNAGVALVAQRTDHSEPVAFSSFFEGFHHLRSLCIVALVHSAVLVLNFALAVGLMWLSESIFLNTLDYHDFPWWILIGFLPVCIINTLLSFASYFVVFHRMGPGEALRASYFTLKPHWLVGLAFYFVVLLFTVLGAVLFIIGILFTYSLFMTAPYAAFKDLVGTDGGVARALDVEDHFLLDD